MEVWRHIVRIVVVIELVVAGYDLYKTVLSKMYAQNLISTMEQFECSLNIQTQEKKAFLQSVRVQINSTAVSNLLQLLLGLLLLNAAGKETDAEESIHLANLWIHIQGALAQIHICWLVYTGGPFAVYGGNLIMRIVFLWIVVRFTREVRRNENAKYHQSPFEEDDTTVPNE